MTSRDIDHVSDYARAWETSEMIVSAGDAFGPTVVWRGLIPKRRADHFEADILDRTLRATGFGMDAPI